MRIKDENILPVKLAFQYLRNKGVVHTQQDIADKLNVSKENISRLMNGKEGYHTPSYLSRFNKAFDNIFDENWLLTGDGIMLNSNKEDPTGKEVEEPKTDEAKPDDSIIEDEPKINFTTGVPYYNVDFIGGFDLVMNDQTTIPEYLIDFKKYNDATCWCNVTGHSMEPEITHGDMIALKEIKDMSFLPFGEVYAIVTTNEMRTIKRLGKGDDKDHYNLIPTNKSQEYAIQELPKRMISAIFQVLGCMKRL